MAQHSSNNDDLRFLADLLATYRSLLATHPNDRDLSVIPEGWTATSEEVLQYYVTGSGGEQLPPTLRELVDGVRVLQLPRTSIDMPDDKMGSVLTKKGMSPKKFHEVQRMASYVKKLVESVYDHHEALSIDRGQLHIVDVGAGQGYITRALGALFPDAKLLALDADHGQTEGAQRQGKGRRVDNLAADISSRIDHRTVLVKPESLLGAVDAWIHDGQNDGKPVPVLFVALHACGSLTPDMLRAFLTRAISPRDARENWYPLGIVTVGCCYNLMYPEDYPLSQKLRSHIPTTASPLPASAYHLAAQIPMTWLEKDSQTSNWKLRPSVQMASRKVVWRALLQFALLHPSYAHSPSSKKSTGIPEGEKKVEKGSAEVPVKWWLQPRQEPTAGDAHTSNSNPPFNRLPKLPVSDSSPDALLQGSGQTETAIRLGKLPDSAYQQGWGHFLNLAGEKLGICWGVEDLDVLRDPVLERRIELLHTVRCILGSAVESAILLDRLEWIQEHLKGPTSNRPSQDGLRQWDVELVNLFDQQTGSGRNIAVVVSPVIP